MPPSRVGTPPSDASADLGAKLLIPLLGARAASSCIAADTSALHELVTMHNLSGGAFGAGSFWVVDVDAARLLRFDSG